MKSKLFTKSIAHGEKEIWINSSRNAAKALLITMPLLIDIIIKYEAHQSVAAGMP